MLQYIVAAQHARDESAIDSAEMRKIFHSHSDFFLVGSLLLMKHPLRVVYAQRMTAKC